MKYCIKCIEFKPSCDFGKSSRNTDGLNNTCKQCVRAYNKAWYASSNGTQYERNKLNRMRIKQWFNDLRNSLSCQECGEDHPATLDFHHLDPSTKNKDVTLMVHDCNAIPTIEAEIAKCIVVCSNCHRKLHWNERQDNPDQLTQETE